DRLHCRRVGERSERPAIGIEGNGDDAPDERNAGPVHQERASRAGWAGCEEEDAHEGLESAVAHVATLVALPGQPLAAGEESGEILFFPRVASLHRAKSSPVHATVDTRPAAAAAAGGGAGGTRRISVGAAAGTAARATLMQTVPDERRICGPRDARRGHCAGRASSLATGKFLSRAPPRFRRTEDCAMPRRHDR